MFTDAEFENACKEIDSPYLKGWEFFTQSDAGLISIYRQHCEVEFMLLCIKWQSFRTTVPTLTLTLTPYSEQQSSCTIG